MTDFENEDFDLNELLNKNVGEILDAILKTAHRTICPVYSLDNFKEKYSLMLDKAIEKQEKETGNTFAGGEFCFVYVDEKHFKISYDLYFQAKNASWIKSSSESKPQRSDKYLTEDAIKELESQKIVKYEITAPER